MTRILRAINLRWGIWYGLQHALCNEFFQRLSDERSQFSFHGCPVRLGPLPRSTDSRAYYRRATAMAPAQEVTSSHRGPHPQTT